MEINRAAEDHKERAHALMQACGRKSSKALLTACAQGEAKVAAYLIQHLGAYVHYVKRNDDGSGDTPLQAAVLNGRFDVARMLVKQFGADVAAKVVGRGGSVLHIAAERGDADTVRVLVVELGASVEVRDVGGSTPLHHATRAKSIGAVRMLLSLGADITSKANGWMPLHIAVSTRCREMVLMLVNDFGADVNARTGGGRTPLHVAVAGKSLEMARLLVGLGADVGAKDENAKTPFICAAEYRRSSSGSLDIVRFLFEDVGAEVAATQRDSGRTPLHIASSLGNAVRVLITEFGAPVDVKDNRGNTPLHLAVIFKNDSSRGVVDILLSCGSYVGAMNAEGLTPLHYALEFREEPITCSLLKGLTEGVVSIADNKGRTPLHLAASAGLISAATIFVEQLGADVNARDALGMTPLHHAASRGREDVVELLVKRLGADIGVLSNDLLSVLHFAAYNDRPARMLARRTGGAVPPYTLRQSEGTLRLFAVL